MRFWDRQQDARRSTRWLLLAFAVCVLLIVASVHLGLSLAWWLLAVGVGGGHLLPVQRVVHRRVELQPAMVRGRQPVVDDGQQPVGSTTTPR